VPKKPAVSWDGFSEAPKWGVRFCDRPVAVAEGNGYSRSMPHDQHGYDDEPIDTGVKAGKRRLFKDFDCPTCSANNPYDDGFGDGDEVLCYYCGAEFKAKVNEDGQLRLREA
jgi:hypothetical protein